MQRDPDSPESPMRARQQWMTWASSPRWLHYGLPAVMALLIAGTLAQKWQGLYQATQHYFLSPVMQVGLLPLPGLPLLLGALALNLLAYLTAGRRDARRSAGSVLTHVGVVFLIGGALLVSLQAQEGFLDLRVGQTADYATDYHERVLVVRNLRTHAAYVRPLTQMATGRPETVDGDWTFTAETLCRSCVPSARPQPLAQAYGMARGMELRDGPAGENDEENIAGISFALHGSDRDGLYATLEHAPPVRFSVAGVPYSLAVEKRRQPLPFTVSLLRTERQLNPDGQEARGYRSRLRIDDHGRLWEAELTLNQPVRYRGYGLYQSGYIEDAEGRRAVIAVVHNPGRVMPYLAGGCIALGMLWNLRRRLRQGATAAALLVLMLMLQATPARAAIASGYALEEFAQLPVAAEGRVQSLAILAQSWMRAISGTERDALQHFFTLSLQPQAAMAEPLILVENAEVRALLGLDAAPQHRYSPQQIAAALLQQQATLASLHQADPATLSQAQLMLMTVEARYIRAMDIAHAFDAFRPLRALSTQALPRWLASQLPMASAPRLLDLWPWQDRLTQQAQQIAARKGPDPTRYTPQERSIATLAYLLATARNAAQQSRPLAVVHDLAFTRFVAPWAVLTQGAGGPDFAASFVQWQELVAQADAPPRWNALVAQMRQDYQPGIGFRLESATRHWPLLELALGLYAAASALLLMRVLRARDAGLSLAPRALWLAVMLQGAAIALRIVILARAPVGTLYESILFVSWLIAASSLWRWQRTRDTLWLWLGALGGGVILLLAQANHPAPGDDMAALTPVLNTNFWLTTHVICITSGYALSLLAAFLAHAQLLCGDLSMAALRKLRQVLLLALWFTATGTLLGGIWADQSWGRFWGWDPKENGALLIVLWQIWLLHGDLTGQMTRRGLLLGTALLALVVMLSWFGVNLLGVGLHSYGFTRGIQWGLAVYALLQLGVLLWLARRLRGQAGAP